MADYFWSARFICGTLALLLGVALLVGGLLELRFGDQQVWYFALLGAALCLDGLLLAVHGSLGLLLCAAILLTATVWTLRAVGLDIWALMPRLLRAACQHSLQSIRRHSVELPDGEEPP